MSCLVPLRTAHLVLGTCRIGLRRAVPRRQVLERTLKTLASSRFNGTYLSDVGQQSRAAQDSVLTTNFFPAPGSAFVTDVRPSVSGDMISVDFQSGSYTFHSQWLHTAQVIDVPSKQAANSYAIGMSTPRIVEASISGQGFGTNVNVTWSDGQHSEIPAPWLLVYAPVVAKCHTNSIPTSSHTGPSKGWLPNTLSIPEFSYAEIFASDPTDDSHCRSILDGCYRGILDYGCPGIIKIVDLPAPNVQNERDGQNTIVAGFLTRVFGNVFEHPRRADRSYLIASHHDKDIKTRGILANYNTAKVLLGHTDQSHYMFPSRINSLYTLEGSSENTFVSCEAALATMRTEAPELVEHLYTAPVAVGRVAHWYSPPLYQANTDSAVTVSPGFPDRVQKFRWHPHLTGSLLSPYDKFPVALAAHQKFQEILRRDTHELRMVLKPGDLYVWDNWKILHGRERVLDTPRTSVGQSVLGQTAADTYREFRLRRLLNFLPEKWLVHVPQAQLNHLEELVDMWHA